MKRRLYLIGFFLLSSIPPALGSVTQVDGVIVPVGNALQNALNAEEGVSPPNVNAIDARLDAFLVPEIFLPDTSKTVTIKDIAEGAGFENSFGYYNVGDDVTNTANLHPILGCNVPAVATPNAQQHSLSQVAGGYIQNAEPGSIASVNFAAELSAGRYKGGFIGFYLITPEGNPSNNNCGDFRNGSDGASLFGKIYFTQRDLNNDGDFVHTLIYNSKLVSDRFYFGAEDLFRGGDNDYEDMATQVNGLTPPCVPVAETCNGEDDDCDGVVDNDPSDVGDECVEGIGECTVGGVTICQAGVEVCGAVPNGPTQELCNGLDDDCNGITDNAPIDVGDACATGQGICANTGVTICAAGFEVCGATPGNPSTEACNGLDDDCDGLSDEDFNVGLACDGIGACGLGVRECSSPTSTRCSTDVGGSQDQSIAEICDGLDNDCDGNIDDQVNVSGACSVGVGACLRTGSFICAGGSVICNATVGAPSAETCDGIDNDCDNLTDEDFGVGNACDGIGACGPGLLECSSLTSARCSTDVGGSQDQSTAENCDGLDNDCDGTSDEGLQNLGACGLSDVGECQDGILRCSAGQLDCVGEIGPTTEFCDNKDNDCNGQIDNNPIGQGASCGVNTGECVAGQQQCQSGSFVCIGEVGPTNESCDSLDNDCDGLSDEDFGVGNACEGIGACGPGLLECRSLTSAGCSTDVGGSQDQSTAESCNGLDDDCDGSVDDSVGDVGLSCTVGIGVCQQSGITICAGGGPVCNAQPGLPQGEICNGLDDDCDGVTDEGFNVGLSCDGIGECGPGVIECASPTTTICSTDAGGSQSQVQPEICDSLDNDCDGNIDDGLNNLGPCGLFPNIGECTDGIVRCSAGQLECVGEVGPTPEFCDGLDNDCDGLPDETDANGDGVAEAGPIDDGGPCGSNFGECREGTEVCFAGQLLCSGETPPSTELCDSLDNDCDGIPDNDLVDPLVGQACGSDVGECDFGTTICTGGQVLCFGGNGPQAEVCDNLDNDCDTIIDGSDSDGDGLLDGLDLNGDGVADITTSDAGQLCGTNNSSNPLCSAGITVCDLTDIDGDSTLGELVCQGGNSGDVEVCNGIDDDCDNAIDDSPTDPELGQPCGSDFGLCEPGVSLCSAGQIQCQGGVGPTFEVCNGLDDDCDCPNVDTNGDGTICGIGDLNVDEIDDPGSPLCADPAQCVLGDCRLPCDLKSARCAGGEVCFDDNNDGFGFCIPDPCLGVTCNAPEVCNINSGDCQLPCEILPCLEGFLCDDQTGECKENNCYGLGCPDPTQLCLDAQCVPDLCADLTCGQDEFCRQGECIKSCETVACAPGFACEDGACVQDLCFGVNCANGEQCVPETGICSNLCRNITCGDGRVCDPATGDCVDDPCTGVVCAESATCQNGQCLSKNGQPGFVTGGGAGCSVDDPQQGSGGLLLIGLFLGLSLLSRRGRKLLFLGIFLMLSGCILDPFFFINGESCSQTQNGLEVCDLVDNDCDGIVDDDCTGCLPTNGGVEACDGVDNNCNGTLDENCQGSCVPSNNGVERCDNVDNDCDGAVDDGFDLTSDFRNCGQCGRVCSIPGAFSSCQPDPNDANGNGLLAECAFDGCAPGNIDLDPNDNDPACTYQCTVTNGGVEACDNIDNDCDGVPDEDTDFDNDILNCGSCGNVCAFFQAAPSCVQAQCTFDPATDCLPIIDPNTGQQTQLHDIDGLQSTGCEYPCNPNPADADPAAPEVLCNGLDDDCDGVRDDGLSLDSDPNNCGGCGRVCTFPNVANPSCSSSVCAFDPATDCNPGTHDIDGNPINGCEYPCVVSNNGVEVCDGDDNDCDGVVDEVAEVSANDPSIGLSCGAPNVGTCQAGATTCIAGNAVCVGAIGPRNETCDGLDNDCDGTIDDNLVDVGRVCTQAIGECSLGLTICTAGALVCEQQIGPAPEVCDGLDNDCDGIQDGTDSNGDGIADQLPVDVGLACGGGDVNGGASQCQEGVTVCDLGALQCAGSVDPSGEICDGVDNDCNGQTDDNAAQVGSACGSNIGECQSGTFVCSNNTLECQGATGPSPEVCDGLDNDCTGLPDDAIDPANDNRIGASCGAASTAPCQLGAQICSGGAISCVGEVGPINESCDGVDNDCDGTPDDNGAGALVGQPISQSCYSGPAGTINVGVCQGGTRTCTNGAFPSCAGEVLPSVEICDGLDNDCNGVIDDGLTDVGQVCQASVGECSVGLTTCQNGALSCVQAQGPTQESCDGLDNDCDGVVDDTPVDVGLSCGGGTVNAAPSQCRVGVSQCSAGILTCVGNIDPGAEICDGVDNDCEGIVDDNPAQVGQTCGSDIGSCATGTFICSAGALQCQGEIGPSTELCDGQDNDCSGIPDDNLNDSRIGQSCGVTSTGACELGVQACLGGAVSCVGEIGPLAEGCNSVDDDCDGSTDEDAGGAPLSQACYTGPNGTNGLGICRGGNQSCTNGSFSGACVGQVLPASEACNGLDDDCDGASDDNGAGSVVGGPLTQSCYTGPNGTNGVGICTSGIQTCVSGSFGNSACVGEVLPGFEICGDGLNNDCDGNVSDTSESCVVTVGGELRLDAATGASLASTAGQHHSLDTDVAAVGNNVYAVFSDNRISSGATPRNVLQVFLARSTNGGTSFNNTLVRVSDNVNRCDTNDNGAADGLCAATSAQVIAFRNTANNNDIVIVSYIQLRGNQTRDIFVAISRDSGATFPNIFRMDADDDTRDSFHFDLTGIKVSNNVKVALAWEELDTGTLSRVVKVRRSKTAENATPTFDAEQTANKGSGVQIAGRPKVVFGNSDRIVAVWREQRSGAGFNGTTDIFANFWDDGQTNINGTDRRIDADASGAAPDDLPVLARLGGELYVAWQDIKSDGADISFARSTDNGSTFGSEKVVDDPNGEVSSSLQPVIFARTASGQNRVYLGWEDDRDGSEIFVAVSTDGGQTFSAGQRASSISNPIPGVSLDAQLVVDASNHVYVTFSSDRGGLEDIFVAFSIDNGNFWQPLDLRGDQDTAGQAPSLLPAMTLLPTGVGVVWVDFRGDSAAAVSANGDIYFRRFSP